MPAQILIPLLVQYGVPFVTQMITLWESKATVTLDQWNALLAQTSQTPQDRMKATLTAAGVDLTSQQAVTLIALAK